MTNYEMLFNPKKIGTMTIKNRLVVPSMVTNYCHHDGTVTDQFIAYHVKKALGGWGLIITEAFKVNPNCGGYENMGGLWEDKQIAGCQHLTDAVHKAGSKIIVQLIHGGRQVARSASGVIPVAPSAIKDPTVSDIPHELSIIEIEKIVANFVDAAVRAQKAGFDGVEIHGAHGYLLNEFLSPFSNKRVDEYGGNIIDRAKIVTDIIKNIRDELGKDFPILLRLSVREYVPGGLELSESQIIARLAQEAGADAIHCAQGVYGSAQVIISPSIVPAGAYMDNAAAIKQVIDIPVIAVGRINTPEIAELILSTGKADFVAMGRASLADPDLPQKLQSGQRAEIQQCIGCVQGCIGGIEKGNTVRCLVNPLTGMETIYTAWPDYSGQKILVAGGGISGCQAALLMAKAGGEVHLYEQSDHLGGQWNIAAMPIGKTEFATLVIWLNRQLVKAGVHLHFNCALTDQLVQQENPDVFIVATGSRPNQPPIKGLSDNVLEANDVLLGKCSVGKRVAVLGGGMVGAEVAEHLACHGHQVIILEMAAAIALDGEAAVNYFLLKNLEDYHVSIYTHSVVQSVTENEVLFLQNGQEKTLIVDSIVKATGSIAYQPFSTEAMATIKQVLIVGDASKAKNGLANLQEVFEKIWKLKDYR